MCPWKTCCPHTVPRRSPRVVSTSRVAVHDLFVGTGIGVALVSRLALTDVPGTTHRELTHPRLHAVTPTETSLAPLVDVILHLLRDVAGHTTATLANER